MNVDCTLNAFKIPGFSGLEPKFGSKKPIGEPISSREEHTNIAMPFALMRPHVVNENSTTTEVEVNSIFDTTVSGITLTLGNAAYNGCMAYIVNSSGGSVSIRVNGGESITLLRSEFVDLEFVNGAWKRKSSTITTNGDMVDGGGRNLLKVLGVSTIPEAMAELRRRCNNNGEIDSSGIPYFKGIEIGDYIDGLDLSGVAAPANGSDAPQAWNDTYKNNRIVVSGFNTYKYVGGSGNGNDKNHVLFTFRNCIARGNLNSISMNTGGYVATTMRAWLEGASGDGSGVFATKLKAALGGDYLYTINKCHSHMGTASRAWDNYTVWLPTEIEVFGRQVYGDELGNGNGSSKTNTNIHFPIFQKGYAFLLKFWNGTRSFWFTSTPSAADAGSFACVDGTGAACSVDCGGTPGGIAPAFCVR